MTKLLLSKEINAALCEEMERDVLMLSQKGITPTLAIIRVGEKDDDISYERGATKKCEKIGIDVRHIIFPDDVSEDELLRQIDMLNGDDGVHGILLLKPLPKNLDEEKIGNAILPRKDVDGITYGSATALYMGKGDGYAPCTASAVMKLFEHYNIELEGKNAVVIGRSAVIGKPVSMLLLAANATVTIAHSRTKDLASICRKADIIVASAGVLAMVDESFIDESKDQIIIDVGIHMTDDGLKGDVVFDAVMDKIAAITPVPGGVGGVTTSILARHTIDAAIKEIR